MPTGGCEVQAEQPSDPPAAPRQVQTLVRPTAPLPAPAPVLDWGHRLLERVCYGVVYYSVTQSQPSLAFVETSVFTRRIVSLGLEGPLRELHLLLLRDPEAGALDPGTGGLRKVRIADPGRGKGKRSGARVHYLWVPAASLIYLIYVYSKDEADSLSPAQKKQLRMVVEAIKQEWSERR